MTIKEKLKFLVAKDSYIVSPSSKPDTYIINHRESNIFAEVDLTDEDHPEINYYLTRCDELETVSRIPLGYAIELRDFINMLKEDR